MPGLEPYTGPTKLVIAFDIGTTHSGISYCILEAGRTPEICAVARYPGQGLTSDDAKVPSLLYYDKGGNVRASGAEVLTDDTIEVAINEGWTKSGWWKFHLCPKHLTSSVNSDDSPPLPPGKSVVDVLMDFIKYLFQCAKAYIQEHHGTSTWSSIEHSIEYIFTYPNDWEGEQQRLYHQSIARAGLIPNTPEGLSRVHMLTEGEANLHFCVSNLFTARIARETAPRGVVIIHAGDWTVNLSMFCMAFNSISCKELVPSECRLQGSAYITRRAMVLLQRRLKGWEDLGAGEIAEITREFDESTKLAIRNDQEPAYVRVGGRRVNNSKYRIASGKLKLTGQEATGLFEETINAIISAFEKQKKSTTTPITTAFLVGVLSTNDWLWSRLQSYFRTEKIDIYRTDNHTNAPVGNGAVLSYIEHCNRTVYSLAETVRHTGAREESSDSRIAQLEEAVTKLRAELADKTDEANRLNRNMESLLIVLGAHEDKHQCEVLYAQGRVVEAAESLIQITTTKSEALRANKLISDWCTEFTHRCISRLEITGDEASNAKKHDEAVAAYSAALSLNPSAPNNILNKWASSALVRGSANEALSAALKFKFPKLVIFRALCDVLGGDGRVMEAVACFRQMGKELAGDMDFHEVEQWKLDFQHRCMETLEKLGAAAMDSQDYSGAAEHFSTMLSLDPVNRMDILVKRSKARALMESWEEALADANEVIKLDPSCYRGYELRHAALHGAGLYTQAVEAFDMLLGTIKESPDPGIRQLLDQFSDARPVIRRIVAKTVRPMPRILIDTTSGRLYDKDQQAKAFESLPIYHEFVSSMTTQLNYTRIQGAVKKFYQYVMLSHKWEYGEPLFQNVENVSVYDLKASSTNIKLQEFCSLVRSLGFQWAWSDTCCVDKSNNVVLQESLVAMFTWYHGSSLTVVYLRDVFSEFHRIGDLQKSIWNTRAWTYQEYVAAEVVRFYTKDWKPYRALNLANHKESPEIVSEMQRATGVSAKGMAVLRPGLDRVREKLFLASKRETTLVEDMAYSLFGIFNVAIPVIYGEGGDRAVGRLLEYVLTGSGDVTILAWTGSVGSHNSCLPKDLTVYDQLVPPHIPLPVEKVEMERITTELRSSVLDLSSCTGLYNQLNALPSPSLHASRLKLPGIVFPLTAIHHCGTSKSEPNTNVYRATTAAFGDVEIKTATALTGMEDLYFVHPWIRPLLDQEFLRGAAVAATDQTTRALRILARLGQPFGALLLESLSRVEYRRVATDALIMVQIRKEVSLTELIDGIRMLEIQ